MLPGYFGYIVVHRKKKKNTTPKAGIKPVIFVNLRSKPGSKSQTRFTNADIRCLQVYGAIIVCTVFYPKHDSINLLYCGALIYGTVLTTIMKNLIQFCNVYQFIQRMNKAYHMSSNYVTSLHQLK